MKTDFEIEAAHAHFGIPIKLPKPRPCPKCKAGGLFGPFLLFDAFVTLDLESGKVDTLGIESDAVLEATFYCASCDHHYPAKHDLLGDPVKIPDWKKKAMKRKQQKGKASKSKT